MDVALRVMDLSAARPAQRALAARLLRLLRQSRPGTLRIDSAQDTLCLALWRLGALARDSFDGVWIDETTGQPVVRDPATLRYFTVDLADPMGPRVPFPHAFRALVIGGEALTVQ